MKFLRLDKTKGSGAPSGGRYAYLVCVDDIDYFPPTDEKGVRLLGDIVLKTNAVMMPIYLSNSSKEFSYDSTGDDDEKSYIVKFSGTHPGTEQQALEFAKNKIEESYIILIPSCSKDEPWKLLGEMLNPLIFTSSHKSASTGSKFTFNFEQRIGSEYIYFLYGGVVTAPSDPGNPNPNLPGSGFDPTKWARIDASNIDLYIENWKEKLGGAKLPPGTNGQIYEIDNALPEKIKPTNRLSENEAAVNAALYTLDFVMEDLVEVQAQKANKDASEMSTDNVISWQDVLQIGNLLTNYTDLQTQINALKAWKAALTDADSDNIVNTLTELLAVMQNVPEGVDVFGILNQKINISAVVDDLTSSLTNAPLSANQGRLLKVFIDNLQTQINTEIVNRATADGNLQTQVNAINTRTSSVVDKMLHYWDATLGKWLSAGIYYLSGKIGIGTTSPAEALDVNGRAKANSLVLASDIGTAVPNELGRKSGFLCLADASGVLRYYSAGSRFVYTPTGNFNMSTIKTAVEAVGMIFNNIVIYVNIGSNNYTCTIDIGAVNPNTCGVIKRSGTGSLSFATVGGRTLDYGVNNITILSGNQSSFCVFELMDKDYVKIKNY